MPMTRQQQHARRDKIGREAIKAKDGRALAKIALRFGVTVRTVESAKRYLKSQSGR